MPQKKEPRLLGKAPYQAAKKGGQDNAGRKPHKAQVRSASHSSAPGAGTL